MEKDMPTGGLIGKSGMMIIDEYHEIPNICVFVSKEEHRIIHGGKAVVMGIDFANVAGDKTVLINKHAQKLAVTTRFSYDDIILAMQLIEENKGDKRAVEKACKDATKYGYDSVHAFVIDKKVLGINLLAQPLGIFK